MFELNIDKLNAYTFSMKHIALANMYCAWYMLMNISDKLPNVDVTLSRIYFTEYGMSVEDLTDKEVAKMGTDYYEPIKEFYKKCVVQRLEDIIDRFGKVGCDNRIPHAMTLPNNCKNLFEELLNLEDFKNSNPSPRYPFVSTSKEDEIIKSLRDAMIINNTIDVNRTGSWAKTAQNDVFVISPEDFSSYTNIIHNAVMNLYRPSSGINATHEDWGTQVRKLLDYVKTLVVMVTRDYTCANESCYVGQGGCDLPFDRMAIYGAPMFDLGYKDTVYKFAEQEFLSSYYVKITPIKNALAKYSGLSMAHAICLPHATNAKLDVSRIKQCFNSDTHKFFCCQEMISAMDVKMKKELLKKYGNMPVPESEASDTVQ